MPQVPEGARARGPDHWPRIPRVRPPGELLPIWQAMPNLDLRFLIVGPAVNAFTHWTGARTVPCIGRMHGCAYCGEQTACYHCYVGAWSAVDGPRRRWKRGRCLVELTPAARLDCPRLALQLDALLGHALVVRRVGPRRRSRATCWIDDTTVPDPRARQLVDTAGVLLRVWSSGPQAVQVEAARRMLEECSTLIVDQE